MPNRGTQQVFIPVKIKLGGTTIIGKTKKNEYFVRSSYTDPVTKKKRKNIQNGF